MNFVLLDGSAGYNFCVGPIISMIRGVMLKCLSVMKKQKIIRPSLQYLASQVTCKYSQTLITCNSNISSNFGESI